MKSTRIKVLISLLLIALSINSKIKREKSKENTESKEKLFDKKGSWKTRLLCDDIKFSKDGGVPVSLGQAYIDGEKFLTDKGYNAEGIFLEFVKPVPRTSDFTPKVYIYKATNQYVVPWRNVVSSTVRVEIARLTNKTLKFQILGDDKTEYEMQILLPYAYVGDYVTIDQAHSMKDRIRQKSQDIYSAIQYNQEKLNGIFPEYQIRVATVQDTMKQAGELEKKIQVYQADIMKKIGENTKRKVTLEKLIQESKLHSMKVETLKSKLNEERKRHQDFLSEKANKLLSNEVLKIALNSPQKQLKKTQMEYDALKVATMPHFDNLIKKAPIQQKIIEESKNGFLTNNDKELLKIHKVYP